MPWGCSNFLVEICFDVGYSQKLTEPLYLFIRIKCFVETIKDIFLIEYLFQVLYRFVIGGPNNDTPVFEELSPKVTVGYDVG